MWRCERAFRELHLSVVAAPTVLNEKQAICYAQNRVRIFSNIMITEAIWVYKLC